MTLIKYRGLTFGDDRFQINQFDGWIGIPDGEYESERADDGHGEVASPMWHGARTVTASGLIWGVALPGHSTWQHSRDDLIAKLRAALPPRGSQDPTLDDLVVTEAGVTNLAEAQLKRWWVPQDPHTWESGVVPWEMVWRCPQPQIYGDWEYFSVSLMTPVGGLTPGTFTPPATPPAKPLGGEVKVANRGNDPEGSPAIYRLTGEQPGNVGLRVNDAVLTFDFPIGVDDVVVVDTETGQSYLNGEYRPNSNYSSIVSDLRLKPGANVIRALGLAGTAEPRLSGQFRPRSW